MSDQEKKHRSFTSIRCYAIQIAMALLLVTLFSCWINSGLYARYVTSSNATDGAGIAKLSVAAGSTVSTDEIVFGDIVPDGTANEWNFTLSSTSEITLDCYVKVESSGNLPLLYEIKYGEETVDLTVGAFTKLYTFAAGNSEKTFTLSVVWPEGFSDVAYSGEIEAVRLIIKAEQKD